MVNEWTVVELLGPNNDGAPRRYTIADGTAVSKGQTLALGTPRTVTVAVGTTAYGAGVASEEHLPSVGVTSISAWTDGIFNAVASGVITVGMPLKMVESNKVASAALVYTVGVVAYAMDTAADLDTINVRLRL